MPSTIQPELATANTPAHTDLPRVSSTADTPSAALPAAVAAKAVSKRVAQTPAKVTVAVKPAAKVAVKSVARSTAPKAAVKPEASATPAVEAKTAARTPPKVEPKTAIAPPAKQTEFKLLKPKKPKLVRDSFTIPKLEYLKLEELKHRSVKLGTSIKKSELIRAGILALASMSDANFLKVTKAIPAIKTGRPAKD
jgi:hypothetical protein